MKPTFVALIEATKQQKTKGRTIGVASVGAGGIAVHKSRPLISGRTKLYHGTTSENVKKIMRQGLLPSNVTHSRSITGVLGDDIKDKAKGLTYATKDKSTARFYQEQAKHLAKSVKPGDITPAFYAKSGLKDKQKMLALRALNPFSNKGIVKMSVPTWHKDVANRVVENPETRGSFMKFSAHHWAQNPVENLQLYHQLKNRGKTFKGGVPTKYIKGSKDYQKLGLKEIGQYIKAKPGRFGAGVALGAAGIGAVGYGMHKLRGGNK